MQLHSYIKSYLDIPVVLGVGVCQANSMTHTYLDQQIHQGQSPTRIKEKIRFVLTNLRDECEFLAVEIQNYHLYVYKIDDQHRFVTLLLHENNVVRSFRAPQLIRKIAENLDESKHLLRGLATQHLVAGQPQLQSVQKIDRDHVDTDAQRPPEIKEVSILEALEAVNELSRFVKKYIGPKIVSNYWQLSRPNHAWLDLFEIKFSAAIRFVGEKETILSPVQVLILREWTQNFMRQCHTIIQDLPQRFESENMPERSRRILSIYTSEYLNSQKSIDVEPSDGLFADTFVG